MSARDKIHNPVKSALRKTDWLVTDDPYVISYGERFLFVDLGAESQFIGAEKENCRIAIAARFTI